MAKVMTEEEFVEEVTDKIIESEGFLGFLALTFKYHLNNMSVYDEAREQYKQYKATLEEEEL